MLPMVASAQDLEGTWKFHPTYQLTTATDLIDTDNIVYALTNGTLVRLDKTTHQVEPMSPATGLTEFKVHGIYYNYDKHYLLVAYNNSNIDLVYDDGRIVNVSGLADVVMNVPRTINDVTFAGDKAYLATDFGLAVVDEVTTGISEFRYYGSALTSVAAVGDMMIIATDSQLYASADRREQLSDFTSLGITQAAARLRPANDSTFFLLGTNALKRCMLTVGGQDGIACTATSIAAATPDNLQRTVGGWLANFRTSKYYYTIAEGTYAATRVSGNNTSLYSCTPGGDGTVWQIDGNGIHVKGNTTEVYKPAGIYMRTNVSPQMFYSYYNPRNNKFYATNHDQRNAYNGNEQTTTIAYLLSYDGNSWVDETPAELKNLTKPGPLAFVPWHDNALFYVIRSGTNVFRIVDGEVTQAFVQGTSHPYTGLAMPRLAFDSQGNLWMCSTRSATTTPKNIACMLPRDKVLKDTITRDDWIVVEVPGLSTGGTFQNQNFCIGRGDVKVTHGGSQSVMTFTMWRGTPDAGHPTVETVRPSNPVDQNGKGFDPTNNFIYCMSADSTGLVWVGSSNCPVFYFDPSEVMDSGFKVTRPSAVDGDVSPYDGYVSHIATDHLNRKWLATTQQGVFVVSPDGTHVLKHFDVDNSGLPSSCVYSVTASPNRAIALTDKGVAELDMTDIPNVIDYTAVTAAPMVVEPSYTGFVTIGQVDVGACVRITDRDGQLVREFTATGSQVAWDTCDDTGERVATGVYNVYAGIDADHLPATPQVRVRVIK